jgi:zinc and cadmium transporter
MDSSSYLFLYSFGIVLVSLVGGGVASRYSFSHRQLQFGISCVAGLMLGVSLLHFIPHAGEHLSSLETLVKFLLAGMLLVFFLERFFCFHHHDLPIQEHGKHAGSSEHGECCGGGHSLHWKGVVVGLTVHSFFDGVALASGVLAEQESSHLFPGSAAFLAIALHKPFEALTIAALMSARKETAKKKFIVSLLFALVVPIGVLAFSFLSFGENQSFIIGATLAFSAGMFLLVALSDLLPELQFHSHDRWSLSFALLLGVFIAWFLECLESVFV